MLRKVIVLSMFLLSWVQVTSGALLGEKPVYEFKAGEMRGFVRPIGHHHGLIIHGPNNTPVTKQGGCTINLEHYVSADGHGQFVPRKEELQTYEIDGQTLTIHFAPFEEWKIHSSLKYDFSSGEHIDITFSFRFEADYNAFEAFVASYMHSRVPPLAKMGGRWIRLQPERGWQMFLPKTPRHGEYVLDGRWGWFPSGLKPHLVHSVYDRPILVTRDENSQYALIQLVDPRECMALSPNNFAPAHDLSLVGHDVKKGETVTVPIRLHYQKIDDMVEVEKLYNQFRKDRAIPEE